ncbi:MAG: SUF system NifU family Fe-S cluster assembly protein [Burkholderiales bacterium]|nr:SUF system NifU family Fe-S cluster assembly protein [Burkholderiales bacterium]
MNEPIEDLYQDLVLEHKRAPRHFGKLAAPTHEARGRNPSCGDDISVQLRIVEGELAEIGFVGQGCAICIASTSMMAEALYGKPLAAADALRNRFRAVLTGDGDPDDAALGKLVSLAGVRRYPNRIKCALLGWHALAHAMQQPIGGTAAPTIEEPEA